MSRVPLAPGEHGKVRVHKTAAGSWEARAQYCDLRGKKRVITASAPSKGAAQRRLAAKISGGLSSTTVSEAVPVEVHAPRGNGQPSQVPGVQVPLVAGMAVKPSMTIGDLGRLFLAEAQKYGSRRGGAPLAPQTLAGYAGALRLQVDPLIGDLRLQHLNFRLLEQVLAEEFDRGRSTKLMRGVLKQMFDLAVRDEVLGSNPMHHVRTQNKPRGEVRALSAEQARYLVDMLDPERLRKPGAHRAPNADLRDVVLLGLATGCRIGEILAMHWSEIALDDPMPRLRVIATMVEPRKGYVERYVRQERPKTRDSLRTLVLPDTAVEMLRRRHECSADSSPYVFASGRGTPLWPNNIRTRLRAAIKEHPDLVGTTPHTLRRTVATHLFTHAGLEASAVQLGHQLPGITAHSYIARRERDLRNVLDDLLPRASAPNGGHETEVESPIVV